MGWDKIYIDTACIEIDSMYMIESPANYYVHNHLK